jgi:hypothetical protein
MKKSILLITGFSILGLGFSTLLAQTSTGSLPSSLHASGAAQVVTPVTPVPAATPRPHHHHHAAQLTSATANSGFVSGPVVGMAAPTATPAGGAAQGNGLNAPMGVATSAPLKP